MRKPLKSAAKQTRVIARRKIVGYGNLVGGIVGMLEAARRTAARAVNAVMTATYWEIGRRIVEHEQHGSERAEYGVVLLKELGRDLTARFGRGFGWRNLFQMRAFYLSFPDEKLQTLSAISLGGAFPASGKYATPSRNSRTRQTLPDEFTSGDRLLPIPLLINTLLQQGGCRGARPVNRFSGFPAPCPKVGCSA